MCSFWETAGITLLELLCECRFGILVLVFKASIKMKSTTWSPISFETHFDGKQGFMFRTVVGVSFLGADLVDLVGGGTLPKGNRSFWRSRQFEMNQFRMQQVQVKTSIKGYCPMYCTPELVPWHSPSKCILCTLLKYSLKQLPGLAFFFETNVMFIRRTRTAETKCGPGHGNLGAGFWSALRFTVFQVATLWFPSHEKPYSKLFWANHGGAPPKPGNPLGLASLAGLMLVAAMAAMSWQGSSEWVLASSFTAPRQPRHRLAMCH